MDKQKLLNLQKYIMELGAKYQFNTDEEETIYFAFNHIFDDLSMDEYLKNKNL